ncbi:hypothetical protein NORO109296_00660 [Nocardiopsis rhodophaea]
MKSAGLPQTEGRPRKGRPARLTTATTTVAVFGRPPTLDL